MLKPVAAGIAITALLACAAGSTAGPAHRHGCAKRRSVTLILDHAVRVSRERHGDKVMCSYLTGHREFLDDRGGGLYAYPPPAIAVAGSIVAYAYDDESDANLAPMTTVVVQDARSGRVVRGSDASYPDEHMAQVGSTVVNLRGSVAWIACPDIYGRGDPRPTCVRPGSPDVVYSLPRGSREPTALDRNSHIDPRSLRRDGKVISWVDGGVRRSAPLG
jgi:hypothetical protein